MDVIVAFARVVFERIVNLTFLRLAGNLQCVVDAGRTRWVGGLALALALCGTGHAGIEQVWEYKVSTLPGQVFPTLPAAEGAMRGVSVEASLLQLSGEAVTATSVIRNYNVPSVPPLLGTWTYPDPWKVNTCYGSEGALVAAAVALNSVNDPCPYDWVANGEWSSSSIGALNAQCGISAFATETQSKPYKVNYNTKSWAWDGTKNVLVCTPQTGGFVISRSKRELLHRWISFISMVSQLD